MSHPDLVPTETPAATPLPIAVRAHTEQIDKKARRRRYPDQVPGTSVLVFDTETTVDHVQALTFGCWRYYRRASSGALTCVEEGLFYADDLPDTDPVGYETLTAAAGGATSASSVAGSPVRLLSRSEWISQVFYPAAWQNRATVVGFNLPFDISRIAIEVSEGRGRNLRGFSFILAAGNAAKGFRERRHVPRVLVKHLNSHAAFIHFGTALQATQRWDGEFVDLRTLTFALTAHGHGLDSACKAFGLPGKADPGEHGTITPAYINYCRTDVARTAQLYEACVAELAALNLPITPAKAFSPASLSKAVLRALGVTPHAARAEPLPPEIHGWFMSAFYGGRAECRIRHTEVSVTLVDFTSMYPTVFALTDLWRYCTAERLSTIDATEDVRELLTNVTLEAMFNPTMWPQLAGIALVEPDADILPVRAQYNEHKTTYNIGVNYLTSTTPLWYTIADLITSTLLTGKPPKIIRAIRLTAIGEISGLQPWTMPGGRTLNPRVEAPWPAMIEHRHDVRADRSLAAEQRDRISLFLKITANAGGYGIYAEYNRQDLPRGETVDVIVHSRDDEPSLAKIHAPEDPGTYSCPPLAAIITGCARLMLAMLERCVTDADGSWAFADTDSMAIVATEDGGLVPCDGGLHLDSDDRPCVVALSVDQVNEIRSRFAALNPYGGSVPGSILKHELDASCFAVAAKRYALYRYDDRGRPRLVPAREHEPCSHGLGHLLNPTDPDLDDADWIVEFWEHELAQQLTHVQPRRPRWFDQPALGRVAITSPAVHRALRHYNALKSYRNQIKPFGFLLHAPGAQSDDAVKQRLIAPYTSAVRQWLTLSWLNLQHPGRITKISTDHSYPGRAHASSYGDNAATYFTHREAKALAGDGRPSGRTARGLLERRHVEVGSITYIGKEANEIEDRSSGLTVDPTLEYMTTTSDLAGLS